MERLEARCVPTTAWIAGGVLNVVGSDGDDSIGLGPHETIYGTVDPSKFDVTDSNSRQSWTFDATQIGSFFVRGGLGNDFLAIGSLDGYPDHKPAVLWGEGGNDSLFSDISGAATLDGGEGDDDLSPSVYYDFHDDWFDESAGPVVLIGGAGDDSMWARVNDRVLNSPGGDQDRVTANATSGDDVIAISDTAVTLNGQPWIDRNAEDFVTINARDGNDTVYGSILTDSISGGGGDDLIFGDYGDDYLSGGTGNNTIHGGDGNDSLGGEEFGTNQLYGDAGDDTIGWVYADDYADGGFGFDTLDVQGTDADDIVDMQMGTIFTGGNLHVWFTGFAYERMSLVTYAGNDRVYGSDGNDWISVGDGADTVFGNGGDDYISDGDLTPFTDEFHGGDGHDDLNGSLGNDRFYGDDGVDYITGSAGSDSIDGGPGDDSIFGSNGYTNGNDTILGGDGNDHIAVFAGNNSLDGGPGDDVIGGDDGNDTLLGGDGDDYLDGGQGDDVERGGLGNDRFNNNYPGGNDSLDGGAGDDAFLTTGGFDTVLGGVGNDSWTYRDLGGDSAFRIFGPGATLLTVAQLSGPGGVPVEVSMADGLESFAFNADWGNDWVDATGYTLAVAAPTTFDGGDGDDTIYGSNFADLLNGGAGSNLLDGGGGDDTLYGGEGNDSLYGGPGNDSIHGTDGSDILQGGDGDDILGDYDGGDAIDGQAGQDQIFIARGSLGGSITFTLTDASLAVNGQPTTTLAGVESAFLGGGFANDTFNLSGWTGSATLSGGSGTGDVVTVNRSTATSPVAFAITDSLLTVTGSGPLVLSGIEVANLTGGSAGDTFAVTGWTGKGTLAGGSGSDRIASTRDANFTLATTSLAVAGIGTLTLSGIEVADLTGGPGANTFNVGGWNGSGSLDGQGGADTVTATRNGNITLSDTALTLAGTLTLAAIETVNLTGGAANNTFNVGDWTGAGALQAVTLKGGGGTGDKVVASKASATSPVNFTVTGSSTSGTLTIDAGAGPKALKLSGIAHDNLVGGSAADAFTLGAWTGGATVNGGSGQDKLIYNRSSASSALAFALTNTLLSINGAGAVTLSSIETANLTGGKVADTFNINGWTGGGALTGGPGTDTLIVSRNANMALTNTSLTGAGSWTLGTIEAAQLTGGTSANTFTLGGWTGACTVVGGGGTDTIVVTRDADMSLTDTSIVVAGTTWSLSGIRAATLTGGNGNNRLNASAFTGAVTLDGGAGSDVLVGGAGKDSLTGGVGRDLLIGGLGLDTINGGDGDDLLIAGTTTYDGVVAALDAILAEWKSTDSYSTRITKLQAGTITGGYRLDGSTVADDAAADRLTGGIDLDWFVVASTDVVTDKDATETKTVL